MVQGDPAGWTLAAGDLLLVDGPADFAQRHRDAFVVTASRHPPRQTRPGWHGWLTISALVVALFLAAVELVPLWQSTFAAVLLVSVTGVLPCVSGSNGSIGIPL